MKYIILFSGGHSSILTAVEAVRRYGKKNVILVNHDICENVEDQDIKRFKQEVSEYLDISITYVNMKDCHKLDQFDISVRQKAFKYGRGTELCTHIMKTKPFHEWLKIKYPSGRGIRFIYGFDPDEPNRIKRRKKILKEQGYRSVYPLAEWDISIKNIEEIDIKRPSCYKTCKHANCAGCLKAGKQHWYVTYCERPDIFEKAKWAEEKIGYAIIKKDTFLKDLEPQFKIMKDAGVPATEHIKSQTFWAMVRKKLK